MDRFMMKAVLTYPTAQEEQRMLAMLTRRGSDTVDQHALTGDTVSISDVEFLRSAARRVHVSDAIMQYAVNIAATSVALEPSPSRTFLARQAGRLAARVHRAECA